MFFWAAVGCSGISGQFLFARIDLYQRRIRWVEKDDKWQQQFAPAYTLAALDVPNDLLHCFHVERDTNKVYEAAWSTDTANTRADRREAYKKNVYSHLHRWMHTVSPERPLQCDLKQIDELIAWSQIKDM